MQRLRGLLGKERTDRADLIMAESARGSALLKALRERRRRQQEQVCRHRSRNTELHIFKTTEVLFICKDFLAPTNGACPCG